MALSSLFLEPIKKLFLFAALDEQQLQEVLDTSHILPVDAGDVIFKQGEELNYFYAVNKGSVKISLVSHDGNEKVIEIVNTGNYFAAVVIFNDKPIFPANAYALESGEIFKFDREIYLKILDKSPSTNRRVLQYMSRRMQKFVGEISDLCLHSASYRLINYLLCFIEDDYKDNNITIQLPAAKNVIAKRLSIQGETFSRILSSLRKQQLIKVDKNKITIDDIMALKTLLK
jgi:CRP-like cAMP-binding protein